MLYKTHVAVTYATVLPLMASSGSVSVGSLLALGLGSVFPDIDHPKSFIGNRSKGVSHGLSMVLGHRGLAHSIAGAAFFLFIVRTLFSFFQLPPEWADWFVVGYLAHLVEDSFSKTGVAWFQPLNNKRLQFGFKKVYYRTGKLTETILFLLACGGILYHLSKIL